MVRSSLHSLRRCRLLFALALCAWLGLAGTAFARGADCCAGMAGMTAMTHHAGAPAPLHAVGGHADCTCAHVAVALPALAAAFGPLRFAVLVPQAWPVAASELPHAPPLRPPLA